MSRRFPHHLAAGIGLLLLAAVLLPRLRRDEDALAPGPRTLLEAVTIAADLGLHHRYPGLDTTLEHTTCVVVADRPLTWQEASPQWVGNPSHPYWVGKVAVYGPGERFVMNHDPDEHTLWGRLIVVGDPALIARLKAGHDR